MANREAVLCEHADDDADTSTFDRLITTQELNERLPMEASTRWRWIRDGKHPPRYQLGKRKNVYSDSEANLMISLVKQGKDWSDR